jgi:hypothetical protein
VSAAPLADLAALVATARAADEARASTWARCTCGEPYDARSAGACDVCTARARRIRAVMVAAGIPDRYSWARHGAPELAERVRDVVAIERVRRWSGRDRLVLGSPVPGAGKTSLGVCALVARIEDGARTALCVDAHALGSARGTYGRDAELLTRALHDEIVMLDDLGAERRDAADIMARVIHERHQHVRATIITTALDAAQLGARYGGALQRRVTEGATIVRLGPTTEAPR